jgi:hypothetical protein
MFPYRPEASSEDPQTRLNDGPRRTRGTSRGLLTIAVVCILLILLLFLVQAIIGWR